MQGKATAEEMEEDELQDLASEEDAPPEPPETGVSRKNEEQEQSRSMKEEGAGGATDW